MDHCQSQLSKFSTLRRTDWKDNVVSAAGESQTRVKLSWKSQFREFRHEVCLFSQSYLKQSPPINF